MYRVAKNGFLNKLLTRKQKRLCCKFAFPCSKIAKRQNSNFGNLLFTKNKSL